MWTGSSGELVILRQKERPSDGETRQPLVTFQSSFISSLLEGSRIFASCTPRNRTGRGADGHGTLQADGTSFADAGGIRSPVYDGLGDVGGARLGGVVCLVFQRQFGIVSGKY